MKRYAIPLAGILCLALWACAQTGPAPTLGGPTRLSSVSCGPSDDLLDHIHYTNFMPVYPFTTEPSSSLGAPQVDPDIQRDLAAAFVANSAFSRNELCTLDGIFINTAQCSSYSPSSCSTMQDTDIGANSWGFRTPSNHKYVAISLGLWRGNQCPPGSGQTICAPSFTEFHRRLDKALLDKTAGMPGSIKPPTFQASADTSGLTVLAAVAHERGHIYWWEKFIQPPGSTPTNLVTLAATFCSGMIYPRGEWQGAPVRLPQGRYVQFGHLNANSPIAPLPTLLRSGRPTDVDAVIGGIYDGGQYPSLLAAYSPDEDFVESFELSVLRNAGLRDVTVNVAGTDRPILHGGLADMRGAEAKLRCFDALSR